MKTNRFSDSDPHNLTDMNSVLADDIKTFTLPRNLVGQLAGRTIILTGATGLIGSTFVRCLLGLNAGIRFILPVRNAEKCHAMFADSLAAENMTIIATDIAEFFSASDAPECDYIVHCASPTDGRYMASHPVDTFLLATESTKAILEYCRRRRSVKGFVYLSSIEYYGRMSTDAPVTEEMTGTIDHSSPRSSYSLGKQAAEFLAFAYAAQYGVPAMTARLTQTFGAGIAHDDPRVFAQFARSAIAGSDIILHTRGDSAKPYCYTTDAVSAIVYILLCGTPGEAYNVATPGTYVTIRELADLFRRLFNPDISVVVQETAAATSTYAPTTKVNLSSAKLQQLGWQPRHDLPEMLRRLVEYLKS